MAGAAARRARAAAAVARPGGAGRARPARRRAPARRCARAQGGGEQASDDELASLATDDAEAFLYESGRGGRRLDDQVAGEEEKATPKQSYEERLEAREEARFQKSKAEADRLGWDQTTEGWKHAKSRGILRDLWDVVDGMVSGKVGS